MASKSNVKFLKEENNKRKRNLSKKKRKCPSITLFGLIFITKKQFYSEITNL